MSNDEQQLTNGVNSQNGNAGYPPSESGSKQRKNKPKVTRLRQQKLPAWQPILTAWTVIPTIFIIGAVSIPIGVVLLLSSDSVLEKDIPYEHCNNPTCILPFTLDKDFKGDVYFYYGLENYFQNHRRYLKSRSDKQLLAKDLKAITDCEAPYDKSEGKIIVPCGAIANSMFNDTFELVFAQNNVKVDWTQEGVVWDVDKNSKFKNPGLANSEDCKSQTLDDLKNKFPDDQFIKPINWKKNIWELDTNATNTCNNGFLNTDFIVWMRTAALPSFRKPYRILQRSGMFSDGLPAGNYFLNISNNYPVSSFHGKKSFIISTTSWAGGRNPFLGIAYIVAGSICIILSVIFLIVHIKFGHSLTEMSNIALSPR